MLNKVDKAKTIFLLTLLIVLERSSTANELQRMFGGKDIAIKAFGGYIVQLYLHHEFICGGSLYSPYIVITAAHCIHSVKNLTGLKVVGGETALHSDGLEHGVLAINLHPEFSIVNMRNDIAVMKLRNPLKGPNIKYIQLCTRKLKPGELVRVAGWGFNNESSKNLKYIKIPIVDQDICRKQLSREYGSVYPGMLCATGYDNRSLCLGDSGGPLVFRRKLCGIASWTAKCGNGKLPDLYSSIYHFREYLKEAIDKLEKVRKNGPDRIPSSESDLNDSIFEPPKDLIVASVSDDDDFVVGEN